MFASQQSKFNFFTRLRTSLVVAIFMIVSTGAMLRYAEIIRKESVYRDLPFELQTKSLGGVSSKLAGIRSNPRIHHYLADVNNCIAKYESKNLVILPDGAIVPFIFNKRNPMRIDWWTPTEMVVDPIPLFINNRLPKSYLILFQSFPMASIAGSLELPDATSPDSVFSYHTNSMRKLFENLPGETVYCGSLIGKFRAA